MKTSQVHTIAHAPSFRRVANRAGRRKRLERAEHEDLLALCESMRQAQEEEIAQLEDWLCEWYEICR